LHVDSNGKLSEHGPAVSCLHRFPPHYLGVASRCGLSKLGIWSLKTGDPISPNPRSGPSETLNPMTQVGSRLNQAGNPATRAKLSLLLDAAQKGVAQNSTATPEHVLVFVSGVMESVVPAEAAAVRRAEAAAEAASRGEGGGTTLLRGGEEGRGREGGGGGAGFRRWVGGLPGQARDGGW